MVCFKNELLWIWIKKLSFKDIEWENGVKCCGKVK